MIEYMVIEAPKYGTQFSNGFDFAVQQALLEGWRPQGGVSFVPEGKVYIQAMIREQL